MRLFLPILCGMLGWVSAVAAGPFAVVAREPWNDTRMDVTKGEPLHFQVSGTWRDLSYTRDANGYTKRHMKPFEGWRRLPDANWFALVGCVGKTLDHCFVVGAGGHAIAMPAAGRLYLFANDVPGFYWNNAGKVSATITRAPVE